MPRDKTESHIKVNIAIREEFMEKGFEGASVRSFGARAGMDEHNGIILKSRKALFSCR